MKRTKGKMERKNNRNKGSPSLLGSHFKFFCDSYFTDKHCVAIFFLQIQETFIDFKMSKHL